MALLGTCLVRKFILIIVDVYKRQAVSLLIPIKAVRVPVAIGLTYAIGKIAHIWIQDGMPSRCV